MSVNVPDDQWNAAARDAGLEPVTGASLTVEEREEVAARWAKATATVVRASMGGDIRRTRENFEAIAHAPTDITRLLAALAAAEAEREFWRGECISATQALQVARAALPAAAPMEAAKRAT